MGRSSAHRWDQPGQPPGLRASLASLDHSTREGHLLAADPDLRSAWEEGALLLTSATCPCTCQDPARRHRGWPAFLFHPPLWTEGVSGPDLDPRPVRSAGHRGGGMLCPPRARPLLPFSGVWRIATLPGPLQGYKSHWKREHRERRMPSHTCHFALKSAFTFV